MDRLFEVVYDDLKWLARAQLRDGPATVDTTALVHEVYVKLSGSADTAWNDRQHFFRVAAQAMRHILIDRARRHLAAKRGSGRAPVDVDQIQVGVDAAVKRDWRLARAFLHEILS